MAELNAVVDLSHHNGLVTFAKQRRQDFSGLFTKPPKARNTPIPKSGQSISGRRTIRSLSNCWFWHRPMRP